MTVIFRKWKQIKINYKINFEEVRQDDEREVYRR